MPANGRWDLIRRLKVKEGLRLFSTKHYNFYFKKEVNFKVAITVMYPQTLCSAHFGNR